MAKSMWNGHLGFGLVQIPVGVFKATQSHDVGFHSYCPDCRGQVGMKKYCKGCSKELGWNEPLRGTEVDGKVVIISEDDVAPVDKAASKQLVILRMIADDINPVLIEDSYFVGAPNGTKAYALLAQSMALGGYAAETLFTPRSVTKRAVIRVVDGRLWLHTLRWPDEVRDPAEVPGVGGDFTAAELKTARMVVDSMVEEFDPAASVDARQEQLKEVIAAKAQGGDGEAAVELDKPSEDELLMARLKASIKDPAKKARKKAPAKRTRRSVA